MVLCFRGLDSTSTEIPDASKINALVRVRIHNIDTRIPEVRRVIIRISWNCFLIWGAGVSLVPMATVTTGEDCNWGSVN